VEVSEAFSSFADISALRGSVPPLAEQPWLPCPHCRTMLTRHNDAVGSQHCYDPRCRNCCFWVDFNRMLPIEKPSAPRCPMRDAVANGTFPVPGPAPDWGSPIQFQQAEGQTLQVHVVTDPPTMPVWGWFDIGHTTDYEVGRFRDTSPSNQPNMFFNFFLAPGTYVYRMTLISTETDVEAAPYASTWTQVIWTGGGGGGPGTPGPPGPAGPPGPPGAAGGTGGTGGPGGTGGTGAPGSAGGTGGQGASGQPGSQGASGADGADGASGATGATGVTGATGAASGVTVSSSTPPTTPDPGALWTTINGELFVWSGTFWIQM
jgi:hypothetical protein